MDLLPRPVVLKFILKRKTCVMLTTTALVKWNGNDAYPPATSTTHLRLVTAPDTYGSLFGGSFFLILY